MRAALAWALYRLGSRLMVLSEKIQGSSGDGPWDELTQAPGK